MRPFVKAKYVCLCLFFPVLLPVGTRAQSVLVAGGEVRCWLPAVRQRVPPTPMAQARLWGNALLLGSGVPQINQPLVPDATPAGGAGFTLTVNGIGFVSSSVVNWNGTALATTFVNGSQLTATVPALNIATAATASITVTNPTPGGGTSNAVFFPITSPTATIVLSKTDYAAGLSPWAIAAGDFNRDGKLDLAVANNAAPGTVSILLGNGDGTFQSPSVYSTGSGSALVWVVTGDFNGDGKLDLVVADIGNNVLWVLLGNGDGTFQSPQSFPTGSGPQSVATGDFNGDGKLDVAVTNYLDEAGGNTVSILLGNGDGTFQPQITFATGVNPFSVVTGDFNGDGILDLAVANGSGTVSILLGNGDGTFQAPSTIPDPGQPYQLVTADFNGDGKLDLAVTNADSAINTISILLGNGDGTFQSPVAYGTGTLPEGISTGDLNGDGKLDLMVTNQSAGTVSVLIGNGDGTFQAQIGFPTSADPVGIATADFNGDGRLDIVTANIGGTNTVSVLLQSPGVALSTASLNFGNQAVVTTSAPLEVSVTNTGSAPLNALAVTLSGADAKDFSQTNNCTPPLLPSDGCVIQVTFTPIAAGARSATLSIVDNAAGSPQTVSLSGTGIDVAPTITTQPVSQTINPGQTATLSVVATGTLPISYQWYQGASGTKTNPIAGATSNSYTTPVLTTTTSYWVQVSNIEGSLNSATATITVVLPLTVTTTALPGGTTGNPYSQMLSASGGTGPFTWSLASGTLPLGLSVNSGGTISGMPTLHGTFNFTVVVTDHNLQTATGALSIVVTDPPSAPTCPPPVVTFDSSTTTNPNQSPLSVAATTSCTSSGLIAKTSIDWGDNTAVTSGTSATHAYAALGNYSVTVTATDSTGLEGTASSVAAVTQPVAAPVSQGQSATQTTNVVAPAGVPSLQVTYECSSASGPNGPQPLSAYHLSCNINTQGSQATVNLTSTQTPVSVVVQTNSNTALATGLRVGPLYAMFLWLPGIALVGTGLCRPRGRRLERYSVLVLLGLLMGSWLACGGGGGGSSSPPPSNATPPGTYGVTVTGTSSGGPQSTVITVGFTVTIG